VLAEKGYGIGLTGVYARRKCDAVPRVPGRAVLRGARADGAEWAVQRRVLVLGGIGACERVLVRLSRGSLQRRLREHLSAGHLLSSRLRTAHALPTGLAS
jgi:hypothetical protein